MYFIIPLRFCAEKKKNPNKHDHLLCGVVSSSRPAVVTRSHLTGAAAAMARSDGCDYFHRTSLFWIVAVTFGMGFYTVSLLMQLLSVRQNKDFNSYLFHMFHIHVVEFCLFYLFPVLTFLISICHLSLDIY